MLSSMPTKSNQVFHAITKVTRYTVTVNLPRSVNSLTWPPPWSVFGYFSRSDWFCHQLINSNWFSTITLDLTSCNRNFLKTALFFVFQYIFCKERIQIGSKFITKVIFGNFSVEDRYWMFDSLIMEVENQPLVLGGICCFCFYGKSWDQLSWCSDCEIKAVS